LSELLNLIPPEFYCEALNQANKSLEMYFSSTEGPETLENTFEYGRVPNIHNIEAEYCSFYTNRYYDLKDSLASPT